MADANHSIDSTPSPPKSYADTPEAAIESLADGYLGDPYSILCCVLARAEAITTLLSRELESEDRDDKEEVLIHGLWDILGNLLIARDMVKRYRTPRTA